MLIETFVTFAMKFLELILIWGILTQFLNKSTSYSPIVIEEGEVAKSVFKEIIASDSTMHWFLDLKEGSKYCWYHGEYENLKIVRKSVDSLAYKP